MSKGKIHPPLPPDGTYRVLTPPPNLPPIPETPPHKLTPEAARAKTAKSFDFDAPTPPRNETAALFQALLSVFDSMDQPQRFEFVEVARLFVDSEFSELSRLFLKMTPKYRRVAVKFLHKLVLLQEEESTKS